MSGILAACPGLATLPDAVLSRPQRLPLCVAFLDWFVTHANTIELLSALLRSS